MKKVLTLIAACLALAAAAQQQTARDYGDFTVDAQVTARGEFRTGHGELSGYESKSNLFVNDRVRLSFGWERRNLSMKIAAQHSGLWQNGGGGNTAGNIAVHEAWAKMTFGKGFFAQVGRQELSYDDERLLGTHDWAATGRAHDAMRIGWENDWHSIHAIASFKQTAQTADFSLYKNMQVLWYHYGTSLSPFQISFIIMNQGAQDNASNKGTQYMQTFGTHATYAFRKFHAGTSLYYQIGKDRMGDDVRAFMLGGNFGWQFSPKWGLDIGDDYYSGSDGMPGTNRTFNPLYGSHHKFLGSMDYFDYGTIPLYGLNDAFAKATFSPHPKFDMSLAAHWFMTGRPINNYLKDPTEEITDPVKILIMRRYNGKYRFSQNLGSEIDLQANFRPWKDVTFQAGYSMMIATETMQFVGGEGASAVQNWGWVSFNINPTVFSTRHNK